MAKPEKLYRTTLVIWSEYHPDEVQMELVDLARDASEGEAFCSDNITECITDQDKFPDTEFFGVDDGDSST